MKATGIVRRVDDLGRVVIPKSLRKTLNLTAKEPVEIFVNENGVVLKKYEPGCSFCGEMAGLSDFKGTKICKGCLEEAKQLNT